MNYTLLIPAAGRAIRALEYTGYGRTPKPFVTVGGKTVFGLIMEEAISSGIEKIGVVVSNEEAKELYHRFFYPFEGKEDIEALFEKKTPEAHSRMKNLQQLSLQYFYQREPLGFGHAIGKGYPLVEQENIDGCVVALADDLVTGEVPAMQQLIDVHQQVGGMIVMVDEVSREQAKKFGVVQVSGKKTLESSAREVFTVSQVVEKPAEPQANVIDGEERYFAVVGRYLLEKQDLEFLHQAQPTVGKELDFTPLFERNIEQGRLTAILPNGEFITVGNANDQQKAAISMALNASSQDPVFLEHTLQTLQQLGVLTEEDGTWVINEAYSSLVNSSNKR